MERQQPTPQQKQEYLEKVINTPNFSEYDLLCFLIGHNCNIDAAMEALKHATMTISSLDLPPIDDKTEFNSLDSMGKLFWLPHLARDSRPVLVWRSKNHVPLKDDVEAAVTNRWLVFNMWRAIQCKVLTEKIYLIVDRSDADLKSFDNKIFTLVNSTFATLFPERNAKTFVIPTGILIRGIWNALRYRRANTRPFMDAVTASKICFLGDPKDAVKELYDDFNLVPMEFGGLMDMKEYDTRASFEKLRDNYLGTKNNKE